MAALQHSKWLSDFNKERETFKFLNSDTCYCIPCEKSLCVTQKSQILQHAKGAGHKKNVDLKKRKASTSQLQLDTFCERSAKKAKMETIGEKLCKAFVSANIPPEKLNNPIFRGFLEEGFAVAMPSASSLRKTFMPRTYQGVVASIKEDLSGQPIFVSADETTDAAGRYVANIIIGKLSDPYEAPVLAQSLFLDKTNGDTITRAVDDTIRKFWNEFDRKLLKVFVTDAAAYMIKAGKSLKVFYPEMMHLTCFAHGLHRVAEIIREDCPEVNTLISSVKKVFLKAPIRIQLWKDKCELPLPPEPVLTRWTTWVKAALFYADHLEEVKDLVMQLDPEDASSIRNAQQILANPKVASDLVFLKANVAFLPPLLTKLETKGLALHKSLAIMEAAKEALQTIPGDRGSSYLAKYEAVMARNPDFEKIKAISDVLQGKDGSQLPQGVTVSGASSFKFCPGASVDVERSFSVYKSVLTDNRHRLTEENINRIMVTHCYYGNITNDE